MAQSPVPPRRARAGSNKRTNDPERTTAAILGAATKEFADKGLLGGRVEAIAAATATKKFMIYYYFGSKEALYIAVLEDAYRQIRERESALHLDDLPPVEALARLVEFAFDYHHEHPGFVRLVMAENMNNGEYLAQSKVIRELNKPVIRTLTDVYARGVKQRLFRAGLDPVDIHMSISALSFHHVSNRPTFSLIFQPDVTPAADVATRRKNVLDLVLRYVLASPAPLKKK